MVENSQIDLRSDTVTRPTPEMRDFMLSAELGDDVYGDDPSVNALESYGCELLGKESCLFVSSGTQSNLLAILSHCERGMECISVETSHIAHYEAGGHSVLGGVCNRVLPVDPKLFLSEQQVIDAIRPDDSHFPISRLLCLENTFHGRVQSTDQMARLSSVAHNHGLQVHLDGARLMNACVSLGKTAKELCAPMDSVSLCLSKGLGAPVGSILCGTSSFISRARRLRKMVGGGLRQSGLLASCGLYALRHHIDRLAIDHGNAKELGEGLNALDGIEVDLEALQTNMVWLNISDGDTSDIGEYMSERGILLSSGNPLRLVCHLDYDSSDCSRIIDTFRGYLGRS